MYFAHPNIDEIVRHLIQQCHSPNLMAAILVGDKTELHIPDLINALNQHHIPFVGGIFPGIIVGNQRYESGVAVTVIPMFHKPVVIKDLQGTSFSLDELNVLDKSVEESHGQATAFVLVDGLTTNIALFLSRLFNRYANKVKYIGGGAGSLSFERKAYVFDNGGMYQDAAIVALLKMQSHIGVRHGWRDLRGPFRATRTNRNVVLELNGEPAFKKYSGIVNLISKKTLNKDNFFDIAKEFPLGLYFKGVDRIVRDPITFTDEGGLVCVGEVRENSLVYILRGHNKELIYEAGRATRDAVGKEAHVDQCFVVDCISRVLFLQEHFVEELNNVLSALPAGTPEPVGMLTLGEIGSYSTGSVEFFNKTIVICAMRHPFEPSLGLATATGEVTAPVR